MKIEQLGPPDADHSTGLILHWREKLTFAVLPARQWRDDRGETLAHIVGIGGHLEPGETWVEAVLREAQEEAAVGVDLCSPTETWFLCDDGTVQEITDTLDWPESPRPLFIWSAVFCFGTPPNEWRRHFVNAVFEAKLPDDAKPCPVGEMPALLAITKTQLCQSAVRPMPLSQLLSAGAVSWTAISVPNDTLIAPRGSAYWYVELLKYREQVGEGRHCPMPDA
jgi:8-oxo-dGTP pyrophosphatase MutT (NUDIX family)